MKVLIASGGSGGHIFPALALAKELEKKNTEIIFVAAKRRLDMEMLAKAPYKKIFLSANPMPYSFGLKISVFLAKLVFDSFYAVYILFKFHPDVCVGFGGYTGGAILLFASMMRTRTLIHEQNIIPGRTNLILDTFADEVCISFDDTKKYFKNKKVVFTGNPLREESLSECRREAFKKFNLSVNNFTILILGGSQGAASLNSLVTKSLAFLPADKKVKIQVLHIAGPKDLRWVKNFYSENGISGKVFGFVESINEVYSACDLAISRAGAAAIFELAAFAKPMILVPYPNPKNSQRLNASYFASRGAAIYKEENKLNESELRDIIEELIDRPDKRDTLSENAKRLSVTDGAKRLSEEVISTTISDRVTIVNLVG